MTGPNCIECGQEAAPVSGDAIYPHRPDLYDLQFWLCECGAYCGSHKATGEPLGYPCGPETRKARSAAHAAFDPLWRGNRAPMYRAEAYAWLARELRIPKRDCHIGMMDADEARRVVALVNERKRSPVPQPVLIGKTKRTSKWKGSPTGEGNPPWVAP